MSSPTRFGALNIGTAAIKLYWTHDGLDLTSFTIEKRLSTVATWTVLTTVTNTLKRNYTDQAISSPNSYVYRIYATNAAETLNEYAATAATASLPQIKHSFDAVWCAFLQQFFEGEEVLNAFNFEFPATADILGVPKDWHLEFENVNFPYFGMFPGARTTITQGGIDGGRGIGGRKNSTGVSIFTIVDRSSDLAALTSMMSDYKSRWIEVWMGSLKDGVQGVGGLEGLVLEDILGYNSNPPIKTVGFGPIKSSTYTHHDRGQGQYWMRVDFAVMTNFFLGSLTPPPSGTILLLDVSGSMVVDDGGGRRYDLMLAWVAATPTTQDLAMVGFSDQISDGFAPEPDSGDTLMATGINYITNNKNKEKIILSSDGIATTESEAVILAAAATFGGVIDTKYFGPVGGPGETFMATLAASTGGSVL